jgi:cell division septation protein DedD
VKTISVRPDGTLIASTYEATDTATAAAPPPSPAAARVEKKQVADADTEASSPAVALPTKLSPPKSGARVVAKTDTTAPADAGEGPAPTAPKPKKPKPTPVAEAEQPKTDDAEAPQAASGGFAVQLAAPRSESEAKAIIGRLQSKYADALSGASIGVRKADRHGETIYRVRAGGMSKADAKAMCEKIKAAGGDCFVAKN